MDRSLLVKRLCTELGLVLAAYVPACVVIKMCTDIATIRHTHSVFKSICGSNWHIHWAEKGSTAIQHAWLHLSNRRGLPLAPQSTMALLWRQKCNTGKKTIILCLILLSQEVTKDKAILLWIEQFLRQLSAEWADGWDETDFTLFTVCIFH